jgi:hypothetical protein
MDAFVVKTARPKAPPKKRKPKKYYTQATIGALGKVSHIGEIEQIRERLKKLLKCASDDANAYQEQINCTCVFLAIHLQSTF